MDKQIAVLWNENHVSGRLELIHGGEIVSLNGRTGIADFVIEGGRLTAEIGDAQLDKGSFATIVTVRGPHDFSFFLRDVRKDRPVWIPEYEAAVTEADAEDAMPDRNSEERTSGKRSAPTTAALLTTARSSTLPMTAESRWNSSAEPA